MRSDQGMKLRAILAILFMLMPGCRKVVGPSGGGQPGRSAQTATAFPRSTPIARKDAFFGLHFDLHPTAGDTSLGADLSEDNIRALLERVRPDYVQYDCKGHPGWAGFPTKVGWPSPGIVKDSLAAWRKVTASLGVGLFIHYSGVWDTKAVAEHPDWARVGPDGRRDPNITSVFGPYVDELLIPQLKEAAAAYRLDGVWADGECWATQLDYAPRAIAAWRVESGFSDAPRSPADPRWPVWKAFNRRAFEAYLAHWIDALHRAAPALQLTSNWMYTTMAPEPVRAKLDFLSGDYSPSLSVDRARVEARYLASTGMPWDLMAWGFDKGRDLGWTLKPPEQLMQEAAVVLMQGGGFQIYNTPTRSGYIPEAVIAQEEAVAAFCRARQAACHKSTTIPQAALLLSSDDYWDRCQAPFSGGGDVYIDLEGALQALLNLHYSVDILADHQLLPRIDDFPLVVVPDAGVIAPETVRALTAYVGRGGRLLLLGEKCARLFRPILGAEFEGAASPVPAELATPGGPVSAEGIWQKVRPTTAVAAGERFPTRDARRGGEIAATVNAWGKGKVAAVYGPAASVYFRSHHPGVRKFIGGLVSALFPEPAVRVVGPPCVDVALRTTRSGELSVELLNTAGMPIPDRYGFTDFVPPIEGLKLTVRVKERPAAVKWVPDGGRLSWDWSDGILRVVIPELRVHGILVIEGRPSRAGTSN